MNEIKITNDDINVINTNKDISYIINDNILVKTLKIKILKDTSLFIDYNFEKPAKLEIIIELEENIKLKLYEIKNGLEKARLLLEELFVSIDINALNREIEGLTVQTMDEHFWDDQDHAKKIYDQLNEMKKTADTYDHLKDLFNELNETYDYVKETEDQDFKEALDQDYEKFEKELAEF